MHIKLWIPNTKAVFDFFLNFILSLACSLGMWLQSKLKSNHMWITFPHECNDFRRLINVKQCLSYRMPTFPGDIGKIAVVSWFNFLSPASQREYLSRNRLLMFIRLTIFFLYLSKMHQENTITASDGYEKYPEAGVQLSYHFSHFKSSLSFWISLLLANASNSDRIIQENHWKMNLYWCKGNQLSHKEWKLINNL